VVPLGHVYIMVCLFCVQDDFFFLYVKYLIHSRCFWPVACGVTTYDGGGIAN